MKKVSSLKFSHLFSYANALSQILTICACSELVEYFRVQMREDPDMASAVAAIRTLLEFLKRDKGLFRLASVCV